MKVKNYSFIEQDPLLFNSAKIWSLKYYIYVDTQNNFDYKLLMRFGSSRSNVSSGPIEEGKKWFERVRYGEWRGKAFSKKTLPLTARSGPRESVDCIKNKHLADFEEKKYNYLYNLIFISKNFHASFIEVFIEFFYRGSFVCF